MSTDTPRAAAAERIADSLVTTIGHRVSADGWSAFARGLLGALITPMIADELDAELREARTKIEDLQADAANNAGYIDALKASIAQICDAIGVERGDDHWPAFMERVSARMAELASVAQSGRGSGLKPLSSVGSNPTARTTSDPAAAEREVQELHQESQQLGRSADRAEIEDLKHDIERALQSIGSAEAEVDRLTKDAAADRAEIVAWLDSLPPGHLYDAATIAALIERGEHKQGRGDG